MKKGFIIGFIFALVLSANCIFALSTVSDVFLSSFPIKVNGNFYEPKMDILNYQGRTYLALREFATITGNEVDFINNTIIVNTPNYVEEKEIYNRNESPSLNGMQITITGVSKKSYVDYYTAKSGYNYVTIYFTLKNISDSNISYNPYYFSVQNSNGQITNCDSVSYMFDNYLSTGELAPGGTISASLTFEEPKGDNNLIFIYTPLSIYNDNSLKIKLQ